MGTTPTYASLDEIQTRRSAIDTEIETRYNAVTAITDRVQDAGRDLNDTEQAQLRAETTKLAELRSELEELDRRSTDLQLRQRGRQIADAIAEATGRAEPRGHSPLLVSEAHLRSHADAIREGRVFGAEERLQVETRANVAVTDMGSPGAWDAPEIREPITLRAFAGIPNSPLTGATAQMPSLTLPAGAAGAAEGTAHGEYDTIDPVNLSTLRYGRWTQVTSFVDAFDDLTAINRAHAIGIARDLNLADGTAIIAAAGSVTAFSAADLDKNVRIAILKVAAAALVDPEDVVLFGSSTALGQINGYAPANGDDRGSVTTRVFGARVYVHEPTTAGNVYAFAPAGFRVFSDRLRSAGTIDPTNGMVKFGQWLHSTPAGVGVVGAAAGVDVVTP
jgi:hypothetical protein